MTNTYEQVNGQHSIDKSLAVYRKIDHVPSLATRERVKAFSLAGFTQEVMARILRISVDTLQRHYQHELQVGEYECLDEVVFVARALALQGNTEMIKLILKTKGAKIGWQEKQVVEHGISKELESLGERMIELERDNERAY